MSPLLQFVLVGVGTLAMRASLVTLLAGVTVPDRIVHALRLVAPAVLAGLVAQGLFLDDGGARGFGPWHVAALVAGVVAWRTKNLAACLSSGLATLWLLLALT